MYIERISLYCNRYDLAVQNRTPSRNGLKYGMTFTFGGEGNAQDWTWKELEHHVRKELADNPPYSRSFQDNVLHMLYFLRYTPPWNKMTMRELLDFCEEREIKELGRPHNYSAEVYGS